MIDEPVTFPRPARSTIHTVLARQLAIVLTFTVVGAGLGLALALRQDRVYQATASISFSDTTQDLGLVGTPAGTLVTPAQLAAAGAKTLTRSDVLTDVQRRLRTRASIDSLRSHLTTEVDTASNLVDVVAEMPTAGDAARLANATAASAVNAANRDARRRYSQAAESLARRLRALADRRTNDAARQAYASDISRFRSLSIVARPAQINETATPPDGPSSPKPVLMTVLGGFLGAMLGVGLAFLREFRDRRLHDPEDIQEAFALPVLGRVRAEALGAVPVLRRDAGDDLSIAAFGILRRNVELLDIDDPPKTIAVASGTSEDGKSTVSVSLACAFASVGRRTLIVDCDLRRPSVAAMLGLPKEPGIADFLTGSATPQEILRHVKVAGEGDGEPVDLVCIPAGGLVERPEDLLASKRFRRFLADVRAVYDVVVIDTSPMLPVVDALEILPHVDARIICGRVDRSTLAVAEYARTALDRLPPKPTGMVITGLTKRHETSLGYDSYAYAYVHTASGSQ